MADRSVYLNNYDDQISSQKRREREASGIANAVGMIGAVALMTLVSRKVSLARAVSAEVKATELTMGRHAEEFGRYAITDLASRTESPIRRIKAWSANISQAVAAPIPTASHQLDLSLARLNKEIEYINPKRVLERYKISRTDIPEEFLKKIEGWNAWKTFRHGMIAPIAPGARVFKPGVLASSGKYGAMVVGGDLIKFGKHGQVASYVKGVRAGVAGSAGSRAELNRTRNITTFKNLGEFVRNTRVPTLGDVRLEHTRTALESQLQALGISPVVRSSDMTTKSVVRQLREQMDQRAKKWGGQTASQFLSERSASVEESSKKAIEEMVAKQMARKSSRVAYGLYKFQMKIGIGEPFAGYEAGEIQGKVRAIKGFMGMHVKDPLTKRPYPIRGPRYMKEGVSVSGMWSSGKRGTYYPYPAGQALKRMAVDVFEGTFIRQMEGALGIGVSVAPNRATRAISRLVGARAGSTGDYAIRRGVNVFGRLAVVGGGAWTAYRLANWATDKITGKSLNERVADSYVKGREMQQNALQSMGIIDAARKAEHYFPGSINSPAASLARATAPFWMSWAGNKAAGPTGGMVGLALGVATALITWGDITQSPEELHRIYTGEQDIPVRKGRWWMFGKTPFGGGKIAYWRPHWYPLMKSDYKYQGQLWDSEKEEIATNGLLAPVLTPLMLHEAWDPYRWEKKHYYDRPYPVTGELFEPTMPFSWLGNATIGQLVKPQKVMHPEYWATPQSEEGTMRGTIPGAGDKLGMGTLTPGGMTPTVTPEDLTWQIGQAAYTTTEQMGIRGFIASTLYEDLTGNPDFLQSGPVAQSASRATGYERSYWDWEIGDPGNSTEFFRRILPHRRRAIEEYNPIPNQMPDWMPGSDYFINFKTGDPYVKVEMGEARLPGAGYESLHTLHSGIPGVYDAMDRFLILSDIAPYSDEYKHYRVLAQMMTREDPYWSEVFHRHIQQRKRTQEEYQFLDTNVPEDVPESIRPFSKAYRESAAYITGPLSVMDPVLSAYMSYRETGAVSPFFMAQFPVAKWFPEKTAEQTYREFRLHGSEFTDWGNPMRDFVHPWMNQIIDDTTGAPYIPDSEKQRREYEEYFDRLEYVKEKRLANIARDQGESELVSQYEALAKKTLTGVDPFMNEQRLIASMPKRERAFVSSFIEADPDQREDIAAMVSPEVASIYRAQWAMRDSGHRARVNVDEMAARANEEFFSKHYLPGDDWVGWHPDVNIRDVQLKTVRNEGMNIHNYDLWESQERQLARKPYVPAINNIDEPNPDMESLRKVIHSQLSNSGYTNVRTYVTRTASSKDSVSVKMTVKRDNSEQDQRQVEELINAS